MDLRRLRAGEWIAAVAGLILLAALFQPWYGPADATAWEAFSVTDLVLAALALFTVAVLVVTAAEAVPALPLTLDALLALAGIVALVFALIALASLPDGADSREWGLWQGLIGVLGVNVGAWLAMRDQRLSKPGKPTDTSGRPVAEHPEVETLPAPDPRSAAPS
jgi:carbon starvation protein CstA